MALRKWNMIILRKWSLVGSLYYIIINSVTLKDWFVATRSLDVIWTRLCIFLRSWCTSTWILSLSPELSLPWLVADLFGRALPWWHMQFIWGGKNNSENHKELKCVVLSGCSGSLKERVQYWEEWMRKASGGRWGTAGWGRQVATIEIFQARGVNLSCSEGQTLRAGMSYMFCMMSFLWGVWTPPISLGHSSCLCMYHVAILDILNFQVFVYLFIHSAIFILYAPNIVLGVTNIEVKATGKIPCAISPYTSNRQVKYEYTVCSMVIGAWEKNIVGYRA